MGKLKIFEKDGNIYIENPLGGGVYVDGLEIGKVEDTFLAKKDVAVYVVASEDSDSQHYRLYSNGIQEYFGIMASNNSGAGKTTFSHAFKSTATMCILLTPFAGTNSASIVAHCDVKSTTSIETECFEVLSSKISHASVSQLSYRVIGPKA